ncbi:MAG: Sugar-specific transcriptional regulator TrmB [Thermoplasmata archaeon]|nr:Sugar-specific transcriptional regulator TrmB [Thermoplasmata archaeon]
MVGNARPNDGNNRNDPSGTTGGPGAARALEALGLDRRSSAVYAHLCIHGVSKAGPIASATRLGRGGVYRALEELTRRGFVTTRPTRPKTYEAVDPESMFARAIEESQARKATIMAAAPVLAAWWAQAAASRASDHDAFRLVTGEANVDATARRMAQRAERVLRIFDKRTPSEREPGALRADRIRDAGPQAVELDLVDHAASAAREDPTSRGAHDPGAPASSWFLVADDKEALFLEDAGSAHGPMRATWTNSPTLVAMASALHASLRAKTRRRA